MCTGLEVALIGATAATAVTQIDAAQDQKKEARRAREEAKAATDKEAGERQAAAAKATQDAYATQQFQKRALRENSLFTGGGTSGGQQTLGV